jgi:hypothetical protein
VCASHRACSARHTHAAAVAGIVVVHDKCIEADAEAVYQQAKAHPRVADAVSAGGQRIG